MISREKAERRYCEAFARYEAFKARTRDRMTYTDADAMEDRREYEAFIAAREAYDRACGVRCD